ncbi:MAG: DUF2905 domain-containing protein [Endomicrobia bacterium]|nr:DUF2905 domain-containing protein [Endomicrobiia bacterium]MCX7716750.1 DUF2905 domain-containing protein [Endomicrobiia bacterium]
MTEIGKFLVILGIVIILIGLFLLLLNKLPYIGKLPGDIYIKKDNFVFYFPLATSILISIIITIILNLLFRRK